MHFRYDRGDRQGLAILGLFERVLPVVDHIGLHDGAIQRDHKQHRSDQGRHGNSFKQPRRGPLGKPDATGDGRKPSIQMLTLTIL